MLPTRHEARGTKHENMGEGDFMPIGGHRRKHDPKHAKAIKEGGKKADAIRKKTDLHHKVIEEPIADEQLLKDLENL